MATAKKAAPKKAITASKSKIITKKVATPTKKVAVASESKTSNSKTPNAIFNIDEINSLIHAVNHSNVNELKLEKGDFKITIKQGGLVSVAPTQVVQSAPAMQAAPSAPAPVAPSAPVADTNTDNLITIKSPMIGTFYRAAGPGKPIFANVGDEINVGDVLCIVEAMKLFNEIESEVSGKIVKVLTDDASPVEYDQPLFLVQPN